MSRIHELEQIGQSIWFDNISRALLDSGDLQELVGQGITGVTSNPSIFENSVTSGLDYDEDIRYLAHKGFGTMEIYETLARWDILDAAEILRPVYEKTEGRDGFVSLEVDPRIAHDTEATIHEAKQLFSSLEQPNVMIKVPATDAGLKAAERLIGAGVNINLTLIFSLEHYIRAAQSYLNGLSVLYARGPRVKGGLPGHRVASVASVFISRTDSALAPLLADKKRPDLQGKVAVALAKTVYQRFAEVFSGPLWSYLSQRGARVQRPLWASTSTKNPDFPDTMYVDQLIGNNTVNTLPPGTVEAFLEHGTVAETLPWGHDLARERLRDLKNMGIDLDSVTGRLQREGLEAFCQSFSSLLDAISQKKEGVLPQKKIA